MSSEGEGASHGSPATGFVTIGGGAPRHRSEEEAKEIQPPAKRMKEGTEESMGTQQKIHHGKASAAAAGEGSRASPAVPSSTQSIRRCMPPYPTTGKLKDLLKWQEECRIVRAMRADDPVNDVNDLPTLREPKDLETARAVKSLTDKVAVQRAACSIVSVTVTLDGFTKQCTGIVIAKWKRYAASRPSFLIATCSKIVCKEGKLLDPIPKLSVVLPDAETISDVDLVHVNDHYDIAILSVSLDFPFELPSIGPGPEYGQEVFVLARDAYSSLMVRRGEIKWLEESDYLGRNYYMFLSCKLPKGGNGGLVIDHGGNTRGMAFYLSPHPAVLSISTIVTCVKMFKKFNHIAHPMLGLGLRTIAFLDVQNQDDLSHKYGIKQGFIVDTVPSSDAESLGIQRGNVITSWLGVRNVRTLPELEDYLLSLGWKCLRNKSLSVIKPTVIVRDLKEHLDRRILLPVTFNI